MLLGSIFPKGLTWGEAGLLNRPISPVFQAIRDPKTMASRLGAGDGSGFTLRLSKGSNLHSLFNDNNEEVENPERSRRAKMLAFQLEVLNNYFAVPNYN